MSRSDPKAVDLGGDLGLRDVETVKERLLEALRSDGSIHVDTSSVTEVDVSILQILISAQKSAANQNRMFTVAAPAAGVVALALQRGGFPPFAGTGLPSVAAGNH